MTITSIKTIKTSQRHSRACLAFAAGAALVTTTCGLVAFAGPASAAQGQPGAPSVNRFGGANREATAVQIADATFGHGTQASVAVLARDDSFADALAGNALAAQKNGPLMVTPTGSLDPGASAELTKILPRGATVYLLGGRVALSDQVLNQVAALGFVPRRLAGNDRYETATKIAAAVSPHPHTVLVATGDNAPDALAAGAAAATDPNGGVVLLTDDKAVPASTAAYLAGVNPATAAVYGVGGQAVGALNSMPAFTGRFTGFSGTDRFDTDAQVASNVTLFPNPTSVGLATGDDGHWPDALAGGAFVGLAHAPLLLSTNVPGQQPIQPPIAKWLTSHGLNLNAINVFGGLTVVPQKTVDAATALATGTPAPGGPTPTVVPPTAALSSNSPQNTADTSTVVKFDASKSKPGGTSTVKSYVFDFGDGSAPVTVTAPAAPTTTHQFAGNGRFDVTVRVTDADGGTATSTLAFYVRAPIPSGPPGSAAGTPVPGTSLLIWAGVYDTHHTSGSKGVKPNPWCAQAKAWNDVNAGNAALDPILFQGGADDGTMCGSGWDTPGVRIQNNGATATTVNITVTLPAVAQNLTPGSPNQTAGSSSGSWNLWTPVTLQPGQQIIFAQTNGNNFDPADKNNAGDYANNADPGLCLFPSPAIPVVHITAGGSGIAMNDSHQIMNEHGTDAAGCSTAVPPPPVGSRSDESTPWQGL
jgi:polyisoprenoid-binding protein YceI